MSVYGKKNGSGLFPHPFSRAYWHQAAGELKDVRMLLFAAICVALRVALKSVSIPIAPSLNIGVGFFVNAFGSMVYGPVVAALSGAVSDTLGALLFPKGVYFFPFIFTEMAGSVVFALFFYRARVTVNRVILSRMAIDLGVNIILQTPIMWLYYQMILGKNYALFDVMRIVKNTVLFPIESVLLALFLQLVIPPMKRLGYLHSDSDGLEFNVTNVIALICLTAAGVGILALYLSTRK